MTVQINQMLLQPEKKKARPIALSKDDEALLTKRDVASECGLKCRQSIDRWRKNPKVGFPAPDLVINRKPYWARGTIRNWKRKLAASLAAKSQTESVK